MSASKTSQRKQAAPIAPPSNVPLPPSPERPHVSLDPRDYIYPSSVFASGASAVGLKLEQSMMGIHFPRTNVSASLLSDDHDTTIASDSLTDPSSSFECFAFDSLPEKSEKSSTRNSPRTTATSKTGLRSSGGAKSTAEDEEGPEMLVTASSGLLSLIDSEVFGSDVHRSNIVNLKRCRKLSLSLNHEATAACINKTLAPVETIAAPNASNAPAAKKVAVEPSNSCESSQSPCNVAGLQAF